MHEIVAFFAESLRVAVSLWLLAAGAQCRAQPPQPVLLVG